GSRSRSLDGDPARLDLWLLGNTHLENAVDALCGDAVGVDRLRQREAPIEFPGRAFDAVQSFGLFILLFPALAGDRDQSLVHADVDVFGAHSRQVGAQYEALLFLQDVYSRHPVGNRLLAVLLPEAEATAGDLVQEPQVAMQAVHQGPGLES